MSVFTPFAEQNQYVDACLSIVVLIFSDMLVPLPFGVWMNHKVGIVVFLVARHLFSDEIGSFILFIFILKFYFGNNESFVFTEEFVYFNSVSAAFYQPSVFIDYARQAYFHQFFRIRKRNISFKFISSQSRFVRRPLYSKVSLSVTDSYSYGSAGFSAYISLHYVAV